MSQSAVRNLQRLASETLAKVWLNYMHCMERYPYRTNALQTCFLMTTGDYIAQFIVKDRRTTLDVQRSARYAFVGLSACGPAMTFWYALLDRKIRLSRGRMYTGLAKTLLDQSFFLPVYVVGFVSVMGALRGERPSEIAAKMKQDLKPMLMTSYCIWPPVMFFNFCLLQLRHRVLAINVVCLFWNAYLSWKAEQQSRKPGH